MLRAALVASFLICHGHLEPPDNLNHVPAIWGDVRYGSHETIQFYCTKHNGEGPWLGCEWWDKDGWHAWMEQGSTHEEACELRHALGHINGFLEQGDPNPKHKGWSNE